jgi:hypothetical protein
MKVDSHNGLFTSKDYRELHCSVILAIDSKASEFDHFRLSVTGEDTEGNASLCRVALWDHTDKAA